MKRKYKLFICSVISSACILASCSKLLEIDNPANSLTKEEVFATENQANQVLMGVYSSLIHGGIQTTAAGPHNGHKEYFSAGLTTLAGALSAGEISMSSFPKSIVEEQIANAIPYWNSAYKTIYFANTLIEGLEEVKNSSINPLTKTQFIAEAKVIRAFSHLQLIQFFGDIPFVASTDFNKTKNLTRLPVAEVYELIVRDLIEGFQVLPADFASGNGDRIRVNKWAAAGLLARTHLYMGDYVQAEKYATEVINQNGLFQLEALSSVFLANSKESLFQLKPTNAHSGLRNTTPEGRFFNPNPRHTGVSNTVLSSEFLNAFEPGDLRKFYWIDSTTQINSLDPAATLVWYPAKYKQGIQGAMLNGIQNEYYTVIRIAEMHLIRAEAILYGQLGDRTVAISDLNLLRTRAGLDELSNGLDDTTLKEYVWKERKLELFVEWGHRWMDLKRSGKAATELSKLQNLQPWPGDWILLYPIPAEEIKANPRLKQNPNYDFIME
jgi:hypothetical protein